MAKIIRVSLPGIVATLLLIPLLILIALSIPALLVIVLLAAAAVAVASRLISALKPWKKKEKKRTSRVIDVEYNVR